MPNTIVTDRSRKKTTTMRTMLPLLVILVVGLRLAGASPPPQPVACTKGTTDCTVTNVYGSFPDRTICRAADASFPRTEAELVAAVAAAAAAGGRRRRRRGTPQLPQAGVPRRRDGTIISTRFLNRTVAVDAAARRITVGAASCCGTSSGPPPPRPRAAALALLVRPHRRRPPRHRRPWQLALGQG